MQAVGFHMRTMLANLVATCNHIPVRRRFVDQPCSVAQALEVLGDWWTLLVVREAFLGARRFSDFETRLDIAKNILTARLAHLVRHGVLERVDAGVHGTRYEYALTAMGKDLAAVMTALRQWGDRWIFGEGNEPLLVIDRRTGRPIPRLRIVGEDGAPLGARDLELRAGSPARPRRPAAPRRSPPGSPRR
jgi:DNA-binding HxlR family transcriptional regulator